MKGAAVVAAERNAVGVRTGLETGMVLAGNAAHATSSSCELVRYPVSLSKLLSRRLERTFGLGFASTMEVRRRPEDVDEDNFRRRTQQTRTAEEV